mgnify:CR=1 FL=1
MIKVENYINGNVESYSQEFGYIYDPSKGEKIKKVVYSGEIDFQKTINSHFLTYMMSLKKQDVNMMLFALQTFLGLIQIMNSSIVED